MDGLKVSDANLVVYVHPSKSTKVSQTILRELSSLLFTFSETFEGVVLAYEVSFLDKCAKILPGVHPYFGVRLKAKLLLFSPKPDLLVEGMVVKLTQESVHVIVLGFSSAIITDKEIREEFVYKTKHHEEVYASRSHKRHVIKVGTMIRFLVKSFDEEILHISGSLVPDHTGSIRWLDRNMEDASLTGRSAKKRREGAGESALLEHAGGPISLDNDHKIKMSKKHKVREA
ncbi:DNA-directed RNA polymerase I subunit rpa43 [Quillaja saponaria]|uniref:DNA-directed RNA polymerase subunit n=1 Tax=Quillaja saponaria TaxID=32244 RepID=A0AAD7P571_QUISA|nr:DNA-directed RNA polymerase I subunit rpa43 [Quillaja saponaria]